MSKKRIIVGLGEILWDVFPNYSKPGGAPANFSFNVNALGNHGICVSALGKDEAGEKLRKYLLEVGLDDTYVQTNYDYPTGKVIVGFDNGEPSYKIHENVAWDHITSDEELTKLAGITDAVCFSTLSQRNEESRKTIYTFLKNVPKTCFKVLDLNLRPPFITQEVIDVSLKYADVVKLNEHEFEHIKTHFKTEDLYEVLFQEYAVKLVCITLGEQGSMFVTPDEKLSHSGFKVDISSGDLVGVGDAFIACVTHHLVKKTHLDKILEKANRYASYLATKKGAMNNVPQKIFDEVV